VKRDLSHGSARGIVRAAIAACATLMILLLVAATATATPTLSSSFDGSATPAGGMTPTWLSADEANGDVYVIDSASDVVDRFSASGAYLGQLRGSDTTTGSFGFDALADEIAVDNSGGPTQGYVYVVGGQHASGGEIAAFDASGRFRWQLATPFPAHMCGVAVDSAGELWTADTGTGMQQRSPADGSSIGSSLHDGTSPCQAAFDATGVAYLATPLGGVFQISPDMATGSENVFDIGPDTDVATDSSNNDVYINQGTQIFAYDSSNVAQPSFDSGQLAGVTVDGAHGTIFVSDGANNRVEIWSRGSGSPKPYVRAGSPTGVSGTDATLTARVNPAGDSTNCQFEYIDDAQFAIDGYASASTQSCTGNPVGSGSSDVDVSAAISGLTANVTYHYRIVATNGAGTVRGADNTFTATPKHHLTVIVGGTGNGRVDANSGDIAACMRSSGVCEGDYTENDVVTLTATPSNSTITWSGGGCSGSATTCDVTMDADKSVTVTFSQRAPTVGGGNVTDITQTSATLNGTANPNGAATTCEFEYGTTASYGTRQAVVTNPGSGTSAVPVRAAISGLTPETLYHYRLDCTNTGGTSPGSDHTFRTLPIPPPTATTGAASGVTKTAAGLAGSVNPNGFGTTCRFEYGTSTSYGSSVDCASASGSGSSAVAASAALAGLSPGTTYHYRIVATNGGGTTNGADGTFTTQAPDRTCATDASLCPPAPAAQLRVAAATMAVKGTTGTLKVACTGDLGARCTGTLKLEATIKVKVKHGKKTTTKRKTITVGTVSYDLAAGSTASLQVKLTRAARNALAKGGLTAEADGLDGQVKLPKSKTRKHKHKKK
jgi:phosphodiesterase/alkaline phosphatase D-like protein